MQGFVQSGAPLNKLGYFNGNAIFGSPIQLVPRGGAGRLPTLWEANLTLGYPIAVGPVTVTLQAYVFNLFNNQIETQRDDNYTVGPPLGYPGTLYDPNVPQQPKLRQDRLPTGPAALPRRSARFVLSVFHLARIFSNERFQKQFATKPDGVIG